MDFFQSYDPIHSEVYVSFMYIEEFNLIDANNFSNEGMMKNIIPTINNVTWINRLVSRDDFKASLHMHQNYFIYLSKLVMFLHMKLNIELRSIESSKRGKLSKLCKYFVGFYEQIHPIDALLNEKAVLLNLCNDLSIVVKKLEWRYMENPSRYFKPGITANIELLKEMTIKSIEPQIENLILKHRREIQELESAHSIELSNIQFHLTNSYEDKIKFIHERIILDVRKSKSIITNDLLQVVQTKFEQRERRDTCQKLMLLDQFELLKSNLYKLRSEIIILRENFIRNYTLFVAMFRSSYLNITEDIKIFYISDEKKFRDQWLNEIEAVKMEVGKSFTTDFDKKELLLIEKLNKTHEEEIEIILENLVNKYNDERKLDQILHCESIAHLKSHYEKKISKLVQTNVQIERKHSDLSACFQKLNEDNIQTKHDLSSILEKNSFLHSELDVLLNKHVPFESLDFSAESYSALVLENSHLKNYIKELEIRKT